MYISAEVKDTSSKREYVYTDLAKIQVGNAATNVYGVVVDATFPHKSFKSSRFIVSLKIVDPSLPIDKKGVCEALTVVFFANKFDDLPVCQRVGELIRIHRAQVNTYKDKKQLAVNICFNSSWALFPPTIEGAKKSQENLPLSFFGKTIHTTPLEQKLAKSLRAWTVKNFAKFSMLSNQYITSLDQISGKSVPTENKFPDFDLQVKIVQLFRLDQYVSEMRVTDTSGQFWSTQIFNVKYRWLREGQYIRVRGATMATHYNGYSNTFGLRQYANILSLPNPCKLAEDMMMDDVTEHNMWQVGQLCSKDTLRSPIVVT